MLGSSIIVIVITASLWMFLWLFQINWLDFRHQKFFKKFVGLCNYLITPYNNCPPKSRSPLKDFSISSCFVNTTTSLLDVKNKASMDFSAKALLWGYQEQDEQCAHQLYTVFRRRLQLGRCSLSVVYCERARAGVSVQQPCATSAKALLQVSASIVWPLVSYKKRMYEINMRVFG